MAIRPDSSKTESITVRVPIELMGQARQVLPNTGNTALIVTALRSLCDVSNSVSNSTPNSVSNSTPSGMSNTLQELTDRVTALEREVESLKNKPDRVLDQVLDTPKALQIAQACNPTVTGQKLRDWRKSALAGGGGITKLRSVGLIALPGHEHCFKRLENE